MRAVALCLSLLIAAAAVPAALAGPGSGTASILPPSDVPAGGTGTWAVTYTASEPFQAGTLRLVIPAEWTTPQASSGSDSGYVSIATDEPTGNPSISGFAMDSIIVAVDTLSTGNTITIIYGDDGVDPAGVAAAPGAPGTYTFAVLSDPTGSATVPITAGSPSLDVVPGPPFRLSIEPNDTTVTAGDFAEYTVYVVDAFDNRTAVTQDRTISLVSGVGGAFYLPTDHVTPTTTVSITTGNDRARVDYRATVAVTGANLFMITQDGKSPFLGDNAFVSVEPGSVSPSMSTIVATSPTVVDGLSSVTVTSRDDFGNPRKDDNVKLSATGSAVTTDPTQSTGSDGEASGVVTNTVAELVTVFAMVDSVSLLSNAQVQFVAGPVDGDNSVVAATTPVIANGDSASVITVTALDAHDNPVAGKSVILSVNPPGDGAILTQPGVTDSAGQATGTLTSTKTGPRTVTATIDGTPVAGSAVVQFSPGPVASFEWTAPGSATAGVDSQVTLTARDAQGNVKTDYTGTVTLTTTGTGTVTWSAPDALGSIDPGPPWTYTFAGGDNGTPVLRVRNTKAETYQLQAQDGGAGGTSGAIVVDPGNPDSVVVVAGDNQTARVTESVAVPPRVRVTDAFGNPVPFYSPVTFRVIEGGGDRDVVAGGARDSIGTTDGSGEVDCDEWTMGTQVRLNRLRAIIDSGSKPFAEFNAMATPGPGAAIVITPPSKNITVSTVDTVRATLTDAYDNKVPNQQVQIFIQDPPAGTLAANPNDPNPTTTVNATARYGSTNDQGRISVLFQATSSADWADHVDAFSVGVPPDSVIDAVYTTVASGATNLRLTLGTPSATAGTPFSLTVDAIDGNENIDTTIDSTITLTPESGSGLEFSLTPDFAVTVTQVTLASGTATIFGRGIKAGDWDIGVSGGELGADTKAIHIDDTGDVDHYVVSAPDSVVAGVSFNVTVEARDVYENRVMGADSTVDLLAVQDMDTTQAASGVLSAAQADLVAGRVVVSESYTVAERVRVRATAAGDSGFSATLRVKAASAHHIVPVSGDTTGVSAGSGVPLVAKVEDAYFNPVAGVPVTFTVITPVGEASVAPPVPTTGAGGSAVTTLTTGPQAGENRVKATISGVQPGLDRVDYLVETVAGEISYLTVTPATTSTTAGDSMGITVRAYDAGDNLLTLDDTTAIDLSSSGTGVTFRDPAGVLNGGTFFTAVVDTVAESFTVGAAVAGGGPDTTSTAITVSAAAADSLVKVAGDTTGVTVGEGAPLEVEVRDRYGNTVPIALVTFQLVPPFGIDGTAYLTDDYVQTDTSGRASTTLFTAMTAGDNVVKAILLLQSSPISEVNFTVSTVAGAIAYYEVGTNLTEQSAGNSVFVTVRARDASNNLVDDDTTSVLLALDTGRSAVWGSVNPAVLEAGTLMTTVTVDTVQTYRVRASTDGNPGVFGLGPEVNIVPDVPAGTITATASRDTVTAGDMVPTVITSDVITDLYGNTVSAGRLITVATTQGTILSPDVDGTTAGNQQAVDATGRIHFELLAAGAPATATVLMQSVDGSPPAFGTKDIVFAPKPALVCNTDPNPNSVIVGDTVSFHVVVENTSLTAVVLDPSTQFFFTDGSHTYTALLADSTWLGGNNSATLSFTEEIVDPLMTPAYYQPTIALTGQDEYDAPFTGTCLLPANSLLVSSLKISDISAPLLISRGRTDTVTVSIDNPSPDPATINSVNLNFKPQSPGERTYTQGTSPDVPGLAIGAGLTGTVRIPVTVSPASLTGIDSIDAVVSGTVGGKVAVDNSLAPITLPTWEVQAGAQLAYVGGTLSPMIVSRGDTYTFTADVHNGGDATVTLDTSSLLQFTDGTRTYTANLAGATAIAGTDTRTLVFAAQTVAADFALSSYNVTLDLSGTENGGPFSTQLMTATEGDQVDVLTPAAIAEWSSNSLAPERVSKQSTVSFALKLVNSGGATVRLDAANTTLSFAGGAYNAALDTNSPDTLATGLTTLQFTSQVVSNAITDTTYFPDVHLEGTENGLPFTDDLTLADSVIVEKAPELAITAIVPSQPRITADRAKPITVKMAVSNNGGAAVEFTSADIRFILGGIDRTSQFSKGTATAFDGGAILAGGGSDTVTFDVSDSIANTMSIGNMTIEGSLAVEDTNTHLSILSNTDTGGKGSLLVQTQADLRILSLTPSKATVTQNMGTPFTIAMPVRNAGQSDVGLLLNNGSTPLDFSTSGWVWQVRPQLASGDTLLAGGETDTVFFDVTKSGSAIEPTSIGATVLGTELNSGDDEWDTRNNLASILVQSEATVTITGVTTSRPTITSGSLVGYTVWVDVKNTGGSAIDLKPDSLEILFPGASLAPTYTPPGTLDGGGVRLIGGASGRITVPVDESGTYGLPGVDTLNVTLRGTEVNSGDERQGSLATTITVQLQPDVDYVPQSLTPGVVSKGANVPFQADVTNPVVNGATVELVPALTRLRFNAGLFDVGLDPSSPTLIPEGPTVPLLFESDLVGTSFPTGPQGDAEIELHWIENGRAQSKTIALPDTDLVVQDAPKLNIVGVTADRPAVTRGQASPFWKVTMELQNSGQAGVELDLDATATRLGINTLLGGTNVTSEYTISQPLGLGPNGAGGDTLAGNTTDVLVFTVEKTGTTPGTMILSGFVEGTDLNSTLPVSDNTLDGGSGSIEVQTKAVLQIVSITPSQSTATVGQTGGYTIDMTVGNIGDAAATLYLDPDSTALSFSATTGWSTTLLPGLLEGGTTLPGNTTGTVRFVVDTTGSPAGPVQIDGLVRGVEDNRGVAVQDSTDVTESGTIELQDTMMITVDRVRPSRPTLTAGSPIDWEVEVRLRNDGGSDAEVDFGSLAVSLADDGGSTVFGTVTQFDGGGVDLDAGANRTFRVPVTTTGTVSTYGSKAIDVSLDVKETNSGRVATAAGAGSVTVQEPAAPSYVAASLKPPTVSIGGVVPFELKVANADSDAAMMVLNRGATRLHFDGPNYTAFLDLASVDTIPADTAVTLNFEPKLVGSAPSSYDVYVELAWTENGDARDTTLVISGGLTVENPPQLAITRIERSQPTVTAEQTKDWDVTMWVKNNGDATIRLNFDSTRTSITFAPPGGGTDNTYTLIRPTALASGADTLVAGDEKEMIFTVATTGTTPGVVRIDGTVGGEDLGSSSQVDDDTFDGGYGNVTVQSRAQLVVRRVTPQKNPVTTGQGGFDVHVVVANTGGSAVELYPDSSRISFGADDSNWTVGVPPGGIRTLAGGGAVDSLVFPVTQAGTPGTWQIDAVAWGVETNSDRPDSATTASQGFGFGNVTVQSPPALELLAVDIDALNGSLVNTGQDFGVRAQVRNGVGAAAKDVKLSFEASGASVPDNPATVLALVPAGSTVTYTFGVTAGDTAGIDSFTVRITEAYDFNSNAPVTDITLTDSIAVAQIQWPASLVIDSVTTSDSTVTRGQTQPWDVIVHVRNAGEAALDLTPPTPGDLKFYIGGAERIDYVVQAPTAFDSGTLPDWVLGGGVRDSLRYTINLTGSLPGTVDIVPSLAATDRNDGVTLAASDSGSVIVENPAGLFILSTEATDTHNARPPNRVVVNRNQTYHVDVVVRNSGEIVDSVLVALNTDGASDTTRLFGAEGKTILADSSETFSFQVTASAAPNPLETFTSSITRAKSRNTGQPVIPQPPVDNVQLVVVETPADLELTLAITAPPGATNGSVSTNQDFVVSALVVNHGQAEVDTAGARLSLDWPHQIVSGNANEPFAPGDSVHWTLRAPSTAGLDTVSCVISVPPRDLNEDIDASASVDNAAVEVNTTEGGFFSNAMIDFDAPGGTTDSTLSTGQTFTVRAAVTPSGDVKAITATLTVPGVFTAVGSTVRNLADGTGVEQEVFFDIIAPATPPPLAERTMQVRFRGTDVNSGLAVPDAVVSVDATVVPRTRLTLSASVVDNTVGQREPFVVTASVATDPGAARIAGTGDVEIVLPPGYQRQSGAARQSFELDSLVTWTVVAPPQPSANPPDLITVQIPLDGIPADENSGDPAVVAVGERDIGMITEGAAIEVAEASARLELDTRVVPGGERDVRLFGFDMTLVDSLVSTARIDTIAVLVLGADGRPLSGPNVRGTLSRLFIDLGGAQPYEKTVGIENPVIVDLTSGGADRDIASGATATATVGVDVRGSPPVQEIRLQVHQSGLIIRDDLSESVLPVVDAVTGEALDGQLTSQSLVILSNQFEEYVHNYPNPFHAGRESTRIAYFLTARSSVTVRVFSLTGELVYEENIAQNDARAAPGAQETQWDGRNGNHEVVRNGIYVCVVEAGGKSAKFRIAVAK